MNDTEQVTPVSAPVEAQAVVEWLTGYAQDYPFLLAFADDGVIWGKANGSKWKTSFDVFGKPFAELRGETLQEAFIFGPQGEIHLYHSGQTWTARKVIDLGDRIIESQVLWGNESVAQKDGFTHLRDRVQQSMEHALPLSITADDLKTRSPRLTIHHFIETDKDTGEARIFLSRLVNLEPGPRD